MHFDLHKLLKDPSKAHKTNKVTYEEPRASDRIDLRMKAWEVKLDSLFKIRFDTALQINEAKYLDTKKLRIKLNELNLG